MRIGWVGGILRSREILVRAAKDAGHSLEVHSGDTGGRGAEGLSGLVDRSDVVVIVVEMNSHGGALQAKELARRRGRPWIIIRRSSVSALQRILKQLHGMPQATRGVSGAQQDPGTLEAFGGSSDS